MAEQHLLKDTTDGVLTLTFNRPDRLNALSQEMMDATVDALSEAAADPSIGCIVLTGSGRGFCAGGDVQRMNAGTDAAPTYEQKVVRQRRNHGLSGLLYTIPKVTIAAINGPAAGAGLAIALACDLRVMSDTAKITTAFAKVGFSGDFGITWPLVRTLGEAKAKELLLLSGKLTAAEAKDLGLVNRVLPADAFEAGVTALAQQIAKGPQTAYRYMKENARLASEQNYVSLLERESYTQIRTGETDDHKEGARAFVEKRAPNFTGR
ncbi:MAG: enoyl-CoA hydratase [Hyphomonas sp.]